MINGLAIKSFDVTYGSLSYPAKLVIPSWAEHFQCQVGSCGLCCLTELPKGVPQIYNKDLDKAICNFYKLKERLCLKYNSRPVGCILYPFFYGVEQGTLLISLSLECPGTRAKTDINPKDVSEIFKHPGMKESIIYLDSCYKAAHLNKDWNNADILWKKLTDKIEDYFNKVSYFPFLLDLLSVISDTSGEQFSTFDYWKNLLNSTHNLIKKSEGLYIATRFGSNNLCSVKVKGSRVIITLFDSNMNRIKKVEMDSSSCLSNLEIDKEARHILCDYVSLNCNRPFLSLACLIADISHASVPINLLNNIPYPFLAIESGAALIAYRDGLKVLDRDSMREVISFSEGNLHSLFVNPQFSPMV